MCASRLFRTALLLCGLLLAAACSAHNGGGAAPEAPAVSPATASPSSSKPAAAQSFTAGNQYVRLMLPTGQGNPTGPVELVEVFSYACPHCAEFAPYMDRLRAELPKGVAVHYMPEVFDPSWLPYAQAFYAARQLGVVQKTHDAFFKAMQEHYPLNSLQDMSAFYARHGVPPKKFLAAATSAGTARDLAADRQTEQGWGVDATPTLVVGRRASDAANAPFVGLMRSNNIDSYLQLQQLGLWMVHEARKH